MNDRDIRRHEGVVVEAGHDMTIAVQVDTVNDEPLPDVRPEAIGPVRWRPKEGDRVVVYERVGPLRPAVAFTYVGLAPDIEDDELVPGYLEPGRVHIIGEDGVTVVSLEDDADAVELPDGADSATSIVRIGREDATEPLVLGGVWRAKMRLILDEMVDTAQALKDAAEAIRDASWSVPATGILDSGGGPCTGSSAATPPSAEMTAVATAAQGVINAIDSGGGLREQLDEAYSLFAFTAREAPRQ